MKMENNLEEILKSFDSKKVEEEKRKGIISIQEKKLNYGKEENIQPNMTTNLYITNRNNTNTHSKIRAQNYNTINLQNNQNNLNKSQNFPPPNIQNNQIKNFEIKKLNNNNQNNTNSNLIVNYDNTHHENLISNNKFQSSHESDFNEFCLLNNIDEILKDYEEHNVEEKFPTNKQGDHIDLYRIRQNKQFEKSHYQPIENNQKNYYDNTNDQFEKNYLNNVNDMNNNLNKNQTHHLTYTNQKNINSNSNNNFKINDNHGNNFNNDFNNNRNFNNVYIDHQRNYNDSHTLYDNKSHEITDNTNKLSSVVEELKFDPDDLQNLIEDNRFEVENIKYGEDNAINDDYMHNNLYNNASISIYNRNHSNNCSANNNNLYYNGNQENLAELQFKNKDHILRNDYNNNINFGNEDHEENSSNQLPSMNPVINNNMLGESNLTGNFIEKFCTNHQLANLHEWQGNFEWDRVIENANLKIFGFKTFRPNQREIINASLANRDIFVCMPTGGGKSLTFQIPALVSEGVSIVVMPLISLIMDQVSFMNGLGVRVIFLNKDGEEDLYRNFEELFYGPDLTERCKLIFLTPEKISQSQKTMSLLRNLYNSDKIDRFVIDEAHCLSQWGREFRPDYLNLRILRREFPRIPLLAITATAPNKIREDIITQLQMRDALFFRSSYNRTNLYIEIRNKKDMSDVVTNMANFIKKKYIDSSGLIYCASRKECETISEKLRRDHGLSASYYHASMPEKQKNSVQEKWKNDEIRIIVATIAFGMGINKADVRFVIHHAMPKSFENYYQEIGRAGRDGNKSHCIMYYNPADRRTQEFLMSKQPSLGKKMVTQNLRKITEIIDFCEEYCECRRVIALLYFDEKFDRNDCHKMCDNCRKNLIKDEKDVTSESLMILKFLNNCHRSNIDMTLNQSIEYLRGLKKEKNKNKKVPTGDNSFGALKGENQENLKKIIRRLIILKFIDEKLITMGENTFVTISISNEGIDYLRPLNKNVKRIIITFPKQSNGNNYEVEVNKNSSDINDKENKSGLKSKKFISKNVDKDLDDYKYNISDNLNLNDLENEKKKKERKYARTRNIEKEIRDKEENEKNNTDATGQKQKKNKNLNQEEDFGFCTQEQFEELLEKLKLKRREILKEENKKIEIDNVANNLPDPHKINVMNENKIKKLSAEEIFPLTGLKELCRKLPSTEKELNSNYIFGVGAKYLSKYGKEFLPEIIKHLNLYEISKSDNHYEEVVNSTVCFSGQKKSFDKNDNQNTSNNIGNNLNRNNINLNNIDNYVNNSNNNLPNNLHLLQTNHKNNVIGAMRKSNVKDTPGREENNYMNSSFSMKNVGIALTTNFKDNDNNYNNIHYNNNRDNINYPKDIDNFNGSILNLSNSNYLNRSHKKSFENINNYAMFNSMTDSHKKEINNNKNKNEILINLNNNLIQADDMNILESFLRDVERYSDEANKINTDKNDKNDKSYNKISPFSIENNSHNKNNFLKKDFHHQNIDNNNYNNINPYEEFNDFDINNLNEFIDDSNPINEINHHVVNEDIEDEEIVNFARQVRDMNSEMNKGKETKKRKRKPDEDNEDDDFEAGGKKPKNSKAEFFKKRAIYAKINKYKQNKKNNFL